MTNLFCDRCGAEVHPEVRFCPRCGASLKPVPPFGGEARGASGSGPAQVILNGRADDRAGQSDDLLGRLAGFFHPVTGAVILGIDWAIFGGVTLPSGGLALLQAMVIGFFCGFGGSALSQYLLGGDSGRTSLAKGFLAGVIVGAPFPIAGTSASAVIFALSGLDYIRDRFLSTRAGRLAGEHFQPKGGGSR